MNNWLWTKGKNTFNMGVEYRRAYQDDNEEQTEGGHFNFSNAQTSVHDTKRPEFRKLRQRFCQFPAGPSGFGKSQQLAGTATAQLRLSPYVQDDIKLNPRLTINVGLRWDIQAPFTENHNNVVFFNQDNPGTFPDGGIPGAASKFGNCTGCAGFARGDIHYGHFGPRFGFAYQLSKKMVVQGGLNIAFLNGGAYEYGTNKVAVNYGNLLTGSFTRPQYRQLHFLPRQLGYQPDPRREHRRPSARASEREPDQRLQQEEGWIRALLATMERQPAARTAVQHVHDCGLGGKPHHSPAQPRTIALTSWIPSTDAWVGALSDAIPARPDQSLTACPCRIRIS